MTFAESYKKNLIVANYVTIVPILLILFPLLLETAGSIRQYLIPESEWDSDDTINRQIIGMCFQILISSFFIIRLLLLGSNKSKAIWISQTFWLLNWLSIFAYFYITTVFYQCCFGGDHFPSFFLRMLNVYSSWLIAYLFISPIKQIATLIFAYFYRK